MKTTNHIEVIARGICLVDNHLLLCRGKKSGIAYLPGGHVEFLETAPQALLRELQEELNVTPQIGRFLGVCEHAFLQNDTPHSEINLLFAMTLPHPQTATPLTAAEDWIEFLWQPIGQLHEIRIEPAPLLHELTHWLKNPGQHLTTGNIWLPTPDSRYTTGTHKQNRSTT